MTLNSLFFIQRRAGVSCYKHSAFCAFLHPCSEGWSQVWRTPTSSPLHERDFLVETLPKYTKIWDVNIVLGYLRTFEPISSLSFKDATLNLTLLLCLTTGQRRQSIHKMDVSYIQEMDGRYRITICGTLKQTKPGRHLEPIDLFAYPNDKKLCVVEHLKEYLHCTEVTVKLRQTIQTSIQRYHFQVD